MLIVIAVVAALIVALLLLPGSRRRGKDEPFDWTHRRPWWRPRWAFPDDR
jgi:hypothetical protein